ncbi:MAG: TraR/DksA C4-type zinc finger protein [Nitrospiraceae bacterium]|nr:TraR/DksA C4-type zinc finger protein [Nitrospiraceae bacterium]
MPSKKTEKPKVKSASAPKQPEKSKPASAAKEKPAVKEKPSEKITSAQRREIEAALSDRSFQLRKELLEQRASLLGEAKREISRIISGENRQIVETALDDGDWSVVDLSEDISFKQLSTHRENLTKIDEALRKLAEGTYGICEDCGEEIDIERLKVMPFAIYCKDDQERREVMEAMERESGI